MELGNKPLWVIEFNKSNRGDYRLLVPAEKNKLHDLSNEGRFIDTLQNFFRKVIEASLSDPEVTEDVKKELRELSDRVENLQEWMEKFEDTIENPEDLSGQDPS